MGLLQAKTLEEGELFCKWLDNRFKANKNVLGAELGPTGSGKSYRDLRKAELWYKYKFNKEFPVNNICFGIKHIIERLKSGELKRGEVLIFEEAGANLGALDFQNKFQKMFTYILQSFRSMNIAIFFNLPYLTMLNKSARTLLHYSSESAGIDKRKGVNKCVPKFHQVNQSTGKVYKKLMRANIRGNVQRVKYFSYKMPSQYLIDAYEDNKQAFLDELLANSHEEFEIKDSGVRVDPHLKPLTEKQQIVFDWMHSGLNQTQTAEKIGITGASVSDCIKLIRKKGYPIPI